MYSIIGTYSTRAAGLQPELLRMVREGKLEKRFICIQICAMMAQLMVCVNPDHTCHFRSFFNWSIGQYCCNKDKTVSPAVSQHAHASFSCH